MMDKIEQILDELSETEELGVTVKDVELKVNGKTLKIEGNLDVSVEVEE
ncbi:MAG: hypothetical protein BTN85_1213 [Candidatus Methanohalarchaeum thermophilum]|uniref:Uncharacterized protein n=1 Tax=Methanohalarchaeum thermophilum TaxID=1903181 RepID=A0A1Q6DWH0_METT1|nr:MAG: hypothetical protein BTN85_1213 [Candidatus Methanohalarchaeum thermophilum]